MKIGQFSARANKLRRVVKIPRFTGNIALIIQLMSCKFLNTKQRLSSRTTNFHEEKRINQFGINKITTQIFKYIFGRKKYQTPSLTKSNSL